MIAQKYWQKTIIVFISATLALAFAGGAFGPGMYAERSTEATYGFWSSWFFQFPQITLQQFTSNGVTPILEGGTIAASAVTLGASFASNVLAPLRLQVEVRPLAVPFTGAPTAESDILFFTKTGAVTVSRLAGGSYHWRARLVRAFTGIASAWQNFGAGGSMIAGSGAGDFTIVLREPVVIVPGIAGTILQKTSDGTEAWPNINEMLFSPSDDYLDTLALNALGNAPATLGADGVQGSTVRAAAILKTAALTLGGGILFNEDFYGNLVAALTSMGYVEGRDLFTAPYDWRLDLDNSISAFAAVVAQARAASPTGKINIIAHSLGGLLVKKYLAGVASTINLSFAPFLDKVVFAGVPELGAPYAFKVLNYGDDLNIPIVNQAEIKKVAQNMPAIYELLPSERYTTVVGSYVQDFRNGGDALLDYAETARFLTSDPTDSRNPALIALGNAFHQGIDTAQVAAPDTYTIVGCGKPTITGYDLYDNGVVDLELGSGDGTVPEVSAMNMVNASHDYFVMSGATGIDHTGLVSDARPVALIADIIGAGVGGGGGSVAPLPQGISSSVADCATQSVSQGMSAPSRNETTIEFSAHGTASSTVDLGVYDASGNYTGITASGTVTLGIPGSEYEKLGNNVFILAPAEKKYKVINHATASGTFAMKVRGYRAGAVDREATYLSVPLTGTSTFAELDFVGFNGNMNLRFGRRRGIFEGLRHPDSIMSAPFARDHRRMEWQPKK